MASRVRARPEGVIARESGDELLVLDTHADRIHQLNATARVIWAHLEAGSGDDEIAESLASEFEVTIEQARVDVAAALSHLRELGLML
jgi:predicted transcriptional regulator